jgi:hypothetical protein
MTTDPTALCGIPDASGFAGLITKAISIIPVVGDDIAKGGLATGIAATTIIIGGSLAAKFAPSFNRPELGKIIKGRSVAAGIVIALPAMLPAVKHGTLFSFAALDMHETGDFFASLIGNTGNPMPYGQLGSVAALFASHTGCILSALAVSGSTLWSMLGFKCKNNPTKLPPVELAQWPSHSEKIIAESKVGRVMDI